MVDVIFYCPHQDDEVLSFGAAIVEHVLKGDRVHLILCTDGCGTNVKKQLGLEYEHFKQARNKEFLWSAGCLGVDPCNIVLKQTTKDGELTFEQAKQMVVSYEHLYPGALHCTFSYTDPHPDHAHLGMALRELQANGAIAHARYFMKTSEMERQEGTYIRAGDRGRPFIQAANRAYRISLPEAGFYSIGYLSVPSSFDSQMDDPRSKHHE